MSKSLVVHNGRILTPQGWVTDQILVAKQGIITAIVPNAELKTIGPDAQVVDAKGGDIVPGFIDLHIHGGGGSDFMDATPYAVEVITAHHSSGGTTALYGTTCGQAFSRIMEAFDNVAHCAEKGIGSCALLGLHVEGPYFALSKKGCHVPEALHAPDEREYKTWIERKKYFRHITLAPELPGALACIDACAKAGVRVAAGHSEATYDDMRKAMDKGLSHVTHIYSAMSTIVKKGPYRVAGVLEATLVEDGLTTEIIADNFHVNPELARLAYKCKPLHKMALITDAMRGMHMPDGAYTFGGYDGTLALVENGVAVDPERLGFASSTCTMADCVRHCSNVQKQPYEEALQRASLVPAEIAGVADRKGSLAVGKDADLTILSAGVTVDKTICAGTVRYDRQKPPAILKDSVEKARVELPRLQKPARA